MTPDFFSMSKSKSLVSKVFLSDTVSKSMGYTYSLAKHIL